jgi:toxin ParE1/3/4
LAEAVRRRLVQKARQLATLPGTLGTIRSDLGPDIRSTPVANYILIFRYTSETVDLLAVLHSSRDAVIHFDTD